MFDFCPHCGQTINQEQIEGRMLVALGSALLFLMVREDNALLVLTLGVISVFDARKRPAGAGLLLVGLGWLVLWRGWSELQRLVEGMLLGRIKRCD